MSPIGYRCVIGKILRIVGKIGMLLVSFMTLIASLAVVEHVAGFWGFVVGFGLAPLTAAAMPIYVLIKWGSYTFLVLAYGGFGLSVFSRRLGEKISPRELWER